MASSKITALKCRRCGAENEWPYVFCGDCGTPRTAIGPLRIGIYLTVIYAAFLGNFFFLNQSILPWNWPLYLLYALGFMQFSVSLTRGSWRDALRIYYWCLFFFGAGFVFIYYLKLDDEYGKELYFALIQIVRLTAEKDPLIFYSLLILLAAVITVPAYLRMIRTYGWINSYRIIIIATMFLALLVLACLRLASWIQRVELYPSLQPELDKLVKDDLPFYQGLASLVAINLFRVFLFEIFVFAAARGFAITRKMADEKQSLEAVNRTSGLTRSALRIILHLKRFVHILENMVRYLLSTIIVLILDVWEVWCAFCREMLFPTAVLSISAFLLYWMANLTVEYASTNHPAQIAQLLGGIAALIAAAMILLGCKTKVAWQRIASFYFQFISWLLPNMLVFFLLLSVSLFLSSYALNQMDSEHQLPFRAGLLTKVTGGVLVALVALIFFRKRSLLSQMFQPPQTLIAGDQPPANAVPAAFTPIDPAPVSAAANPATPVAPAAQKSAPEKPTSAKPTPEKEIPASGIAAKTKQQYARIKQGLAETTRSAMGVLNLADREQHLRETAKKMQQRMQRKPKLLTELVGAKEALAQKEGQIAALQQAREKVSDKIYQDLNKKYIQERTALFRQRDELQEKLDEEHASNLVRKIDAEKNIERLNAQQKELDFLRESGALDAENFNAHARIIKNELDLFREEHDHYQRLADFYAPEATKKEL